MKERIVSKKYADRSFSLIGISLILYCLFALLLPQLLKTYMDMYDTLAFIKNDEILYFGTYYIILLLGTVIPFFIMRKASKVSLKRIFKKATATFKDTFIQTLVFFMISSCLMYLTTILANRFEIDGQLVSPIGAVISDEYFTNYFYAFIFVIVTPILEEYAFRGCLLRSLSKYGRRFALIAMSFMCAIAHTSFLDMLPSLFMAYYLGKIALRYRSIQPTMIIHIFYNAFIYCLCIVPINVANYMSYALIFVYLLALYFIFSGKYQGIVIQGSSNNKTAAMIFCTNGTIILATLLFIAHSVIAIIWK